MHYVMVVASAIAPASFRARYGVQGSVFSSGWLYQL